MKELKKISILCFRSKMSFHKVIFKPITTAQWNLHFYDLYAHFRTSLSSHIQNPKKKCPKLYFYKRPSTASSAAYYFFYFYLSKALLGSSTRWQKQIFFIRPQHGGRDPLGKDQNEMPSNRGNIISASAAY